ncbi:DinB family protein [Nocardioides sp. LHG3406-4]|uniref:DinB family protein n=1 Tax=Nocardioides sp. LHG3406-4 TaxID=2804575 RepID=UPI003CF65DAB
MTTFPRTDELEGAVLVGGSLRGARFTDCDLSGVVMRAVELRDVDIDAPWLFEKDTFVRINGVDVVPLVRAELERRFPGRDLMTADDPDGLQAAWASLERAWAGVLERVAAMPPGTVDESVDGEWTFAQTQRHLVLATDLWLRGAVLGYERPFHPLGLADASAEQAGLDLTVFATGTPSYGDVLEARADRVAAVREFIEGVTADDLARPRRNPWSPESPESTLSCLHTILHEEWEHLRFAVRDLDAIEAGPRP